MVQLSDRSCGFWAPEEQGSLMEINKVAPAAWAHWHCLPALLRPEQPAWGTAPLDWWHLSWCSIVCGIMALSGSAALYSSWDGKTAAGALAGWLALICVPALEPFNCSGCSNAQSQSYKETLKSPSSPSIIYIISKGNWLTQTQWPCPSPKWFQITAFFVPI